jgi:3-oxoacyl-[acyl-carrier-protein] synthase II
MSEKFLVRPQQTPIVFLGAGAISAAGKTAQETHDALIAQRSGIRIARPEDITQLAQMEKITGKSALEIFEALYKSGVMALIGSELIWVERKDDRFMQLADISTREALEASGILEDWTLRRDLQDNMGINIGTGIGGLQNIETWLLELLNDPTKAWPVRGKYITSLLANLASGKIWDRYHIRWSSNSSNAACASGGYALLDIANAIEAWQLQWGIVWGAESAAGTVLGTSFDWMMGKRWALSRDWKNHVSPDRALQAFWTHRDGFVIGEGAATQVLMTRERADALHLPYTVELLGVVWHACTPGEDGQSIANATLKWQTTCIQKALQRANIKPAQVKAAYLHLTGTEAGDTNEAAAIRVVFGENMPILTGNKPYVGHTLGAAFSLSLTSVLTAMKNGKINSIPTWKDNIDPAFSDLNIAHESFDVGSGDIVLVNAFWFGGQNVTAIVRMV